MTRGCLDLLSSGSLGGAAVTVCRHPEFRTGSVLYEALFVIDAIAPPSLGLRRFLPPTVVRLLLDNHGDDLAERLPHHALVGLCLSNNKKLADTVIRSQQSKLGPVQERAEQLAGKQMKGIVERARQHAREQLDGEFRRLQALAEVNPSIRADELAAAAARRSAVLAAFDDVRLRFDALRLIVMR
jgi:ATP-dependent helicase HepA